MITLFTTFFLSQDTNRQKELLLCLQKNSENVLIKNIFLFLDGQADKETKEYILSNLSNTDKLTFIELNSIPTYGDWISTSKKFVSSLEDVSVFTNADIYVDETISLLQEYTVKAETIVCLSRHDVNQANEHIPHPNPHWSQDLWAISKENILKITNQCFINELTIISTGMYRCDNKLAYTFAMRGWEIYNPFLEIKCYHVQQGVSRGYGKFNTDIVGSLCFVNATDNPDKPSELDISVMPIKVGKITKCAINKYLEKSLYSTSSHIKTTNIFAELPIVIVCKNGVKTGTEEITQHAVQQAVSFKNYVHLVADFTINFESEFFTQHKIDKFHTQEFHTFNENYVHMSSNNLEFEKTCLNRHIIIKEFMSSHKFQNVFHLDYDVLLYTNINDIKHYYKDYDFTLSHGNSPHTSFFTYKMYIDLIEKMLKTYTEKENYFWYRYMKNIFTNMQIAGSAGGVCDMTFLNHFKKLKECNNKFLCGEMTDIIDNTTFDHQIKNHKDYESDNKGIKNIIFKDNIPHCYNNSLNKLIRFNSLHFQGKYKELIKDYITYNK